MTEICENYKMKARIIETPLLKLINDLPLKER